LYIIYVVRTQDCVSGRDSHNLYDSNLRDGTVREATACSRMVK